MLLFAIANFRNKKDHVYFHWYSTDSVSLLPFTQPQDTHETHCMNLRSGRWLLKTVTSSY